MAWVLLQAGIFILKSQQVLTIKSLNISEEKVQKGNHLCFFLYGAQRGDHSSPEVTVEMAQPLVIKPKSLLFPSQPHAPVWFVMGLQEDPVTTSLASKHVQQLPQARFCTGVKHLGPRHIPSTEYLNGAAAATTPRVPMAASLQELEPMLNSNQHEVTPLSESTS